MPLPVDYIGTHNVTPKSGRRFRLSGVRHQSWVDPAALDDNGFVTTHLGQDAAGTVTITPDGALAATGNDFARNIIVTVTHASSIVAMSGVVSGTDIHGRPITAAWSVTATGTSKTSATAKAFKTVTSVTETVVADASGNSIIVGNGYVFGLDMRCASVVPVSEEEDGAAPTAGVVVAGAGSDAAADWRGSYDPNSAPNGALDFDLWYLVDDEKDIY